MRLLTIGVGTKGAEISSLLYKRGVKVNRIPLFRCYAVLNNLNDVSKIKLDEKNKFYLPKNSDVTGIINEIMSRYEIHEGAMLITSIKEEDFNVTIELSRKLREVLDDPVMVLGVLSLKNVDSGELRRRIKSLKEFSDYLLLTREESVNETVEALNILARVGEIDLKRRVAGEVVVDTSDLFNALARDGFTVLGQSKRSIPIFKFFMKRSQLLALRTQRMVEMVKDAVRNLSFNGDIESAKSSLIVFAGNPDEITMDGLFASISFVESLNDGMVVRYGDYPIPRARFLSTVVLFSGLRKIKFD
ncbi:FtsZ/tubulin family protein [Archaeoglobus profundus]|uniref:Cell division GTPase-like protein n=1 Tax=Archaeoglobus profundus (strain DSM 5631 / JCM 9629 / NBRC 100127 / Av18) TaxID=572546 RepID=D2RGP1_ARCPA|nr:cell division protein [Archaeoglobus profundus]ADB57466.1 Cell division GTPase-like protein [Archaeoglobus profundus DSM 5631]